MDSPTQYEVRLIICPLCNNHFMCSYPKGTPIVQIHEGTLYACCRLYRNITDSVESKQEHMNSILPMEDKQYTHHTNNRCNDTIFPHENTV